MTPPRTPETPAAVEWVRRMTWYHVWKYGRDGHLPLLVAAYLDILDELGDKT